MWIYLFSNHQWASSHKFAPSFPKFTQNFCICIAWQFFAKGHYISHECINTLVLMERIYPDRSASFKKCDPMTVAFLSVSSLHPLIVIVILSSNWGDHTTFLFNGYTTFYLLHFGKTYVLSCSNKGFEWTTKSSCSLVQFLPTLRPASLLPLKKHAFSLRACTMIWDSFPFFYKEDA